MSASASEPATTEAAEAAPVGDGLRHRDPLYWRLFGVLMAASLLGSVAVIPYSWVLLKQMLPALPPVVPAEVVLAISFAIPNISWGGHVGGLIGGIIITLAYAEWRRGRAQYGNLDVAGILGLIVVAAGSVALAYWKVRGYA